MKQLIRLEKALFRPLLSDSSKTHVFCSPISFQINSNEKWAITGSHKLDFLKILGSQFIATPTLSRTYPFANKEVWPSSVIQLLDFKGVVPTSHISARYEFFKDEHDNTALQFIRGYDYNSNRSVNSQLVEKIIARLKLNGLEDRWVMGLSNGQMRRARIARALIHEPKLLILDDPFLGLDPEATEIVSETLDDLSPNPYVILGLRYQDKIPDWITHLAVVDANGLVTSGPKNDILPHIEELKLQEESLKQEQLALLEDRLPSKSKSSAPVTQHIKLDNISVAYRGQDILKDLSWTVNKGEKWHIRGNNGTGKSTLLALITADHPQSWNSKIIVDGVPRKTGRQSFFDINEKIGFTSPELHALFPGELTVSKAISTGFVTGSFIPPKQLTGEQSDRIEAVIEEFRIKDLRQTKFKELSVSDQKLVLFLRAIIKNPDLLILDEALSVMDDVRIEHCKKVIDNFENTVLSIGHIQEEVARCEKYLRLIGPGKVEIGVC